MGRSAKEDKGLGMVNEREPYQTELQMVLMNPLVQRGGRGRNKVGLRGRRRFVIEQGAALE